MSTKIPRQRATGQARKDTAEVRLNFGRFRGRPIEGVPDSYLEWLWRNIRDLVPLQPSVEAEYRRRLEGSRGPTHRLPEDVRSTSEELLTAGQAALVQRASPGDIQRVDTAARVLQAMLRGGTL